MIVHHLDPSETSESSQGPDLTCRANDSEASSVKAAGFASQKDEAKLFSLTLSLLFIVGLT